MKKKIQSTKVAGKTKLTAAQRLKIAALQQASPDGGDMKQALESKAAYDQVHTQLSGVLQLLKEAREKEGISLRELELRTGISRGSLSRLESGDGNPTIATLDRFAKAIGREVMITLK